MRPNQATRAATSAHLHLTVVVACSRFEVGQQQHVQLRTINHWQHGSHEAVANQNSWAQLPSRALLRRLTAAHACSART